MHFGASEHGVLHSSFRAISPACMRVGNKDAAAIAFSSVSKGPHNRTKPVNLILRESITLGRWLHPNNIKSSASEALHCQRRDS